MIRLKTRLSLFNLLSKLAFTAIFLLFLPVIIDRINLRSVDNELIQKREDVIQLISSLGIEPFITADSISSSFGSYNILKEEFINLERIELDEDLNYIEESKRLIENEEIEYRVLNYSFKIDDKTYLLEVGKSLFSIKKTGENIRKVMLLFLALIIIITFLADFQYTRSVLKPLDRITGKLKGISDPAIFDRNPLKTSTLDFVSLDNALCELMQNIDTLFRKEKEITVNISHELMTPVSILRSKLENILLRNDINEEIAIKTEESLKTLSRLQSLINSLLLISRIESNQFIRNESFSLGEIIKDIIDELAPVAEDAGLKIENNSPAGMVFNQGNRSLIFSMLYNIINNAIKNTPDGGLIKISGQENEEGYLIAVSDTGKGLTGPQLNNLFQRFRNRTEDSSDGTGIGLAITKTIADFHKIDIRVKSEPGKGTEFFFLFPRFS